MLGFHEDIRTPSRLAQIFGCFESPVRQHVRELAIRNSDPARRRRILIRRLISSLEVRERLRPITQRSGKLRIRRHIHRLHDQHVGRVKQGPAKRYSGDIA